MQFEILPNGELAVEREGLRHVANVAPHLHVVRSHRVTEKLRPALGGRQQTGQHLHRRRLAATVGAEKAEDFAPWDAEVDMIHGDELAEPPRESLRLDSQRLVLCDGAGTDDHLLMQGALCFRQQSDEGFFECRLARLFQHFVQRATGDDLAVIHGHEPVEALGFVHIGRRHHHAHLRASRPDRVDEVPELTARKRIHARRRFVENEQIRIVDERATEAELLLHAPGKFACGTILERIQSRGCQELGDPGPPLGLRLAEQTAEEIDILEDAKRRVKIAT
jgi:hypothetical protein